MPDDELKKLLLENKELLEKIYATLERQRRMRMWSLVIAIVLVVVPVVAVIAALPWMIKTVQQYYDGLVTL